MAGIVIPCVFLAAMSLVGIVFPKLFWQLGSWRYRNAEAMEPTAAQYNLYRARFAALLTLSVPPLIGLAWPGEEQAKLNAWVAFAIGSVVLYIAVLIIIAIVRSKNRVSTIDHERPSELSEAGYGEQWFIVGYTLFCTLLIAFAFSALSSQQELRAQQREDEGLTDAQRQEIENVIGNMFPTPEPPTVIEHPELPVLTAVPEGAYIQSPTRYQFNDAGAVRVGAPLSTCPMAGLVVIETSVNISFGIVYDASAANGMDAAKFCNTVTGANTLEFIPVPIVIGDRATLTLDGDKLYGLKY